MNNNNSNNNNNQSNRQSSSSSNDEDKTSSKSSSESSKKASTTTTATSNSVSNITTASQQNDERKSSTTYATSSRKQSHRYTFPHKLHRLLADDTISDIVSWLPHGKSWVIHKQPEFEDNVLPRYFGDTKMSTFVRQVTGWGFRRITFRGPDYKSYYHVMFKRDDEEFKQMKRPVKDKVSKEDTPNFYDLPVAEGTSSSATSAQVGQSRREQPLNLLRNLSQDQLLQQQGHQNLGLQGYISLASANNAEALLGQQNQLLNTTIASRFAPQQHGLTGLSLAQQQQLILAGQNLHHQQYAHIRGSSGDGLQRQYASLVNQSRLDQNSQHTIARLAQQLANRQVGTSDTKSPNPASKSPNPAFSK